MRRGILGVMLLLMVAGMGFVALRRPVPEDHASFALQEEAARAVLKEARSRLMGSPPLHPVELTSLTWADLWLTLHAPGGDEKTVPLGEGGVGKAVEALVAILSPRDEAGEAVFQLDIEIDPPWTGTWPGPFGLGLDPGIDGALLAKGGVRVPGWFLAEGMKRSEMASWFAKNDARPLRTVAYVEGGEGRPVRRLLRGALLPDEPLTPEGLLKRSRWGGDYLLNHLDDKGRYDYEYNGRTGKKGKGYNVLRHAGTTYSLLQLYRRTRDPRYLEGADRALGWLRKNAIRPDPHHPDRRMVVEGRKIKLGGAGLTLLVLAERMAAEPESPPELREEARALGRHILAQQDEEGWFDSYYAPTSRYDDPEDNSIYYPGEAILGLARWAQVDPEGGESFLACALKGANFLVKQRWRALGLEVQVPPDAWLVQALEVLDRIDPNPERREYALAIARGMIRAMYRGKESISPVLLGAYAGPGFPNLVSAGSRSEALAAAAALTSRHVPEDREFLEAARLGVAHVMRYQYSEERLFLAAHREKALGGIPSSAVDSAIRIDGVQHNLSGWLLLLPQLSGEEMP